MIEIRAAGAKGVGVFATQAIARGTRILAEKPLLLVQRERDIFAAARQLSAAQQHALQQLSINPIQQSDVLGWTQALWQAARLSFHQAFNPPDHHHHHHHHPQEEPSSPSSSPHSTLKPQRRQTSRLLSPTAWLAAIAAQQQLQAIFRNNNFDLGGGQQAVFARTSRLNHACVPAAQGNFHAALRRFTVHALRDLRAGEEVTISYLAEPTALREARQRRLQAGYGFLCGCGVCDPDPADVRARESEARRVGVRAALRRFAEGEGQGGGGGGAAAELEATETLLQFYEAEGLRGRELATVYVAAAELAAKLGLEGKAQGFAEKGLVAEEEAVGLDSPLYEESRQRVRACLGT